MKEHRVVSGRRVTGWSALGKLGRRGTGRLGGPQGGLGAAQGAGLSPPLCSAPVSTRRLGCTLSRFTQTDWLLLTLIQTLSWLLLPSFVSDGLSFVAPLGSPSELITRMVPRLLLPPLV